MQMKCTLCGRTFDSKEGYVGSAESPACMLQACVAKSFGSARNVMDQAVATVQAVNGFDDEQYRQSNLQNNKRGSRA